MYHTDRNIDTALTTGNYRSKPHYTKRTCFKCGSPAHLIWNCPKLGLADESSHKAKPVIQNQNEIEETDSAFRVSKREKENNWLIDSGATSHMTHNNDLFNVYNNFEVPQKVTFGDGHVLEVVGKGNIEIFTRMKGQQIKRNTMYDVLHVPGLKANLFFSMISSRKESYNTIWT